MDRLERIMIFNESLKAKEVVVSRSGELSDLETEKNGAF